MRWMMVVVVVIALNARGGAPECQEWLANTKVLQTSEVEDRPIVAIGLLADGCSDVISTSLQKNLSAIGYMSPEDRAPSLGNTSGEEEARADFESACPGWGKSALATQFVGGKPVTVDVFKQCNFARFGVFTAAEFAKGEVHYATTAVVVFDALKRGGVDAKIARAWVRFFVLPLEAGPPPPAKAVDPDWIEKTRRRVEERQKKK
ncbi:MAG: hypothetical protein QM817_08165 [Archangium sp.]